MVTLLSDSRLSLTHRMRPTGVYIHPDLRSAGRILRECATLSLDSADGTCNRRICSVAARD